MNDTHPHEDELDVPDTLPPAILDALRQLDGPTRLPPPALDEAVLSGARQHFKQTAQNRGQRRLFLFGGAGAALATAAAIAVAFVLTTHNAEPDANAPMASEHAQPNATHLASDFNADGQTDIADAMLQARAGDLPQAEIDALCYALVEVVPGRSAFAPSPFHPAGWGEGPVSNPQRTVRSTERATPVTAPPPTRHFSWASFRIGHPALSLGGRGSQNTADASLSVATLFRGGAPW